MNAGELRHVVVSQSGKRKLVGRSGFVREADLQSLILSSPELLDPLGVDTKFVPIGWEVPVGPGSLDLLFIDSEGILTLVETKLRANDESRRQVIGQVLEYASYASEWTPSTVRAITERFLASDHAPPEVRGMTFEDALTASFGWNSDPPDEQEARIEALVAKLDASVSAGKLRVVCGVDERIESLERLVKYFSAHSDLEVALLQVNRFQVDDETVVLVPTFHGGGADAPHRGTRSSFVRLTRQTLLEGFEREVERQAVERFLLAAGNHRAAFEYGSNGVSIRVRTRLQPSPVTVAWVFPPEKWGWMRTRDVTLGHGLEADGTNPQLKRLLDGYFQRISDLGCGSDASSKGVKAMWFHPTEFIEHEQAITSLMTDIIVALVDDSVGEVGSP